jgi:hypothetical protein
MVDDHRAHIKIYTIQVLSENAATESVTTLQDYMRDALLGEGMRSADA